jgi:hypothetical protein
MTIGRGSPPPDARIEGRRFGRLWCLLPAVLLLPSLTIGFLQDDWVALDYLQDKGFGTVVEQFWPGSGEFYRPLGFAFLWIAHSLFGTHAAAWHALHLALFVAAAILTGRLAERTSGLPIGPWACALALVYPGRMELMVWLISIFDLLALIFVVCAALATLTWWERPTRGALVAVALCVTGACLSKEVGFSTPIVLGALVAVGEHRGITRWQRWAPITVSIAIGAAAAVYRTAALGGVGGYAGTTLERALAGLTRLPATTAAALFAPVNPNFDAASVAIRGATIIAMTALLVLVATSLLKDSRRRAAAGVGAAVILAGLLPVAPYLRPQMVFLHSRYLSLTGAGIAIVAASAAGATPWRRLVPAVLLVTWSAASILNAVPWFRAAVYRDTIIAAVEEITRDAGHHVVWIKGPVHDTDGAHVLGGDIEHSIRVSYPDRSVIVDSAMMQRRQRRPVEPPTAREGDTIHILQVAADRRSVRVVPGPPR